MPLRNTKAAPVPLELSSSLGRYRVYQAISVGAVASVHIAVFEGAERSRKTVAIKRLVAGVVHEPAEEAELTYEACVGAHIHHPNVVSVLDLGKADNGPFVVTDYVLGETIAGLLRTSGRVPIPIAVAIVRDALRGLEAAHRATDGAGEPLDIVHRNVCPENVLVGVDGVARVIDFGASISTLDSITLPNRQRSTRRPHVISPEQLMNWPMDGRADVFAAAIVLWELVAGSRPFRTHGGNQAFLTRPARTMPPASAFNVEVPPAFESVLERALAWSPRRRFESAIQFAEALEAVVTPSTRAEVGDYVSTAAATTLAVQRNVLDEIEAPHGRSAPAQKSKRPEPIEKGATREKRVSRAVSQSRGEWRQGELRSAIAGALRPARPTDPPGFRVALPFRRWATRSRSLAFQHGSTILASLSLLCLVSAATRASLASRQVAASAAQVTIAARPPVRSDNDCSPATSPPVVPAPAAERPPVPVSPTPSTSSRVEPAAPARGPSQTAKTSPDSAAREASDEHERARPRPPVRRATSTAERLACDPPFTIDESGIRRIKLDCM